MVNLDNVPYWWVHLGIGHALLSECTCGQCEDRYQGLCGLGGPDGTKTTSRPAEICAVCAQLLASPCIARLEAK
jgi:hypothetical protein